MEFDSLTDKRSYFYVEEKFRGKVDLAGKPYINHLYRVAYNEDYSPPIGLTGYKASITFRSVSFLHDVLEDIDDVSVADLLERFPEDVVNAVLILTKKKGQTYEEYIEEVGKTELTTRVKLADLSDNMDVRRLPVLGEREVKRLQKYHKAFVYLSEKLKLFQN